MERSEHESATEFISSETRDLTHYWFTLQLN